MLCISSVFKSSFLWWSWSTDELSAVRNAKEETAVPSTVVGAAFWFVHRSWEFTRLTTALMPWRGASALQVN